MSKKDKQKIEDGYYSDSLDSEILINNRCPICKKAFRSCPHTILEIEKLKQNK